MEIKYRPMALKDIAERRTFSQIKINLFRTELGKYQIWNSIKDFTIFCAGSYGRLEAEMHSDMDLFFLSSSPEPEGVVTKEQQLRLFGKLIETADTHSFPPFSNDCQYLEVHSSHSLLKNLGSRDDDSSNTFTIRLLMLLEGNWIYDSETFRSIQQQIVRSYYRDYPDHSATFEPVFLMNDIVRFWNTLKVNYENKRNQPDDQSEQLKIKQKIRNFKLKYSRMTICHATLAALGSFDKPLQEQDVLDLISVPPLQRLEDIPKRLPDTEPKIQELLEAYTKFLEYTKLPTTELEGLFSDKQMRTELFAEATQYGDLMFELIMAIDQLRPEKKLARNLIV